MVHCSDIICTAVNYVNFLHAVPGEPPQNVVARNEFSTTISVEWESPPQDFLFGILRGYLIRYLPGDMNMVNLTERIPPTTTSFTLENLFEFTNYSIEVTAVTGTGEGPYSPPVYVVTNLERKLCQTSVPSAICQSPPCLITVFYFFHSITSTS